MRDIVFDPQMTSYDMACLEALCEQVRPKHAVEIGSWKGLSSSIIARYSGLLFCVDTWRGAENEPTMKREAMLRSVFSVFQSNIEILGLTEKIRPMLMSSAEALKVFRSDQLEFVYIDGDHSYEAVMQDLTWFDFISPGGILAGHDNDEKHPGVQQALKETFGDKIKLMEKSSIWFIQKEVIKDADSEEIKP